MPGYQTHMSVAGATAIGMLMFTNWEQPALALITQENIWLFCAALVGGLFPDVDIKSKGQKLFYSILSIILTIALWTKSTELLTACGILAILPPLFPHRGITHEVWFIILAPLAFPITVSIYQEAFTQLSLSLYFYFVIGALSHIVLDFGPKRTLLRLLRSR